MSAVDGESSSTDVQRKSVVYNQQDEVTHTERRTNEKPRSRDLANSNSGTVVTQHSNSYELSSAEDRPLPSTNERTSVKRVRFQPNRLKVTLGGGQSYT